MQHLVVLDIVEERAGHAFGGGGHKDRCARNAGGRILGALGKYLHRQRDLAHAFAHQFAPTRPCGEQQEGDEADQQREPAAFGNFGKVGGKVCPVHDQEERHNGGCIPPFPLPNANQQHCHQERVNRDSTGHCNAVSIGEIGRCLEGQNQQDHCNHQRPIDEGNIDLPALGLARMHDREARDIAHLDRLMGDRERA